jgi:hypothetical protein
MEINSCIESDIAARYFATSVASAYTGHSTKTIKISDHFRSPSGLERLLEHKKRLRKLWQETRDPPYKTAVTWGTKTIRRMGRRRKLERRETKIEHCVVVPQAVWLTRIVKFLTKMGGPKAPTAKHGPLDPVFYANERAYLIEKCLENVFAPHKVCVTDHERLVEVRVQDLLNTVDEPPTQSI